MASNPKLRVLVADDHPIVRRGLRSLIESQPDLELAGEAEDGLEAVAKYRELHPDVTVLDLVMPGQDGLAALAEIRQREPQARVLVFTAHAEDERVFPAIMAGALGYLLKDATEKELLDAIRRVARGEAALHPAIARRVIKELHRSVQEVDVEPLTERETQVLSRIGRGLSNQEIAAELQITERTVRTHVNNILGKLHLANRTQAARYALREGFAQLEN